MPVTTRTKAAQNKKASSRGSRRQPTTFGELDTTPTSHGSDLDRSPGVDGTAPQLTSSKLSPVSDAANPTLMDGSLIPLNDVSNQESLKSRDRSAWSDVGSLTRRSTPVRDGETPQGIWQFGDDDSINPFSSPHSGRDKLPDTLPLPDGPDIAFGQQVAEKPATRKVDFSETASTTRRSSPFGLGMIFDEEPWDFDGLDSLVIASSRPASRNGSAELPDTIPLTQNVYLEALPPSAQVEHDSERKRRSMSEEDDDVEYPPSKRTDRGPVDSPWDGVKIWSLPLTPGRMYPKPHPSTQLGGVRPEEQPSKPAKQTEPAMRIRRSSRKLDPKKRKQRAKPPVKFDEATQTARDELSGLAAESPRRMPLVSAMTESAQRNSIRDASGKADTTSVQKKKKPMRRRRPTKTSCTPDNGSPIMIDNNSSLSSRSSNGVNSVRLEAADEQKTNTIDLIVAKFSHVPKPLALEISSDEHSDIDDDDDFQLRSTSPQINTLAVTHRSEPPLFLTQRPKRLGVNSPSAIVQPNAPSKRTERKGAQDRTPVADRVSASTPKFVDTETVVEADFHGVKEVCSADVADSSMHGGMNALVPKLTVKANSPGLSPVSMMLGALPRNTLESEHNPHVKQAGRTLSISEHGSPLQIKKPKQSLARALSLDGKNPQDAQQEPVRPAARPFRDIETLRQRHEGIQFGSPKIIEQHADLPRAHMRTFTHSAKTPQEKYTLRADDGLNKKVGAQVPHPTPRSLQASLRAHMLASIKSDSNNSQALKGLSDRGLMAQSRSQTKPQFSEMTGHELHEVVDRMIMHLASKEAAVHDVATMYYNKVTNCLFRIESRFIEERKKLFAACLQDQAWFVDRTKQGSQEIQSARNKRINLSNELVTLVSKRVAAMGNTQGIID